MNQRHFLFPLFICSLTYQSFFAKPRHAKLAAQREHLSRLVACYEKKGNQQDKLCETKPPKTKKDFTGSKRKRQRLASIYKLAMLVRQHQQNQR